MFWWDFFSFVCAWASLGFLKINWLIFLICWKHNVIFIQIYKWNLNIFPHSPFMPGKHWAIPSSPTNWDCICGFLMCKQSFSNSRWLNRVYDKKRLSLPCSLMCSLLFRGWVSMFIRYREVCSSIMLFQMPRDTVEIHDWVRSSEDTELLKGGRCVEEWAGVRAWRPHLLLPVGNVIKIWRVQCIRQGNVTCPINWYVDYVSEYKTWMVKYWWKWRCVCVFTHLCILMWMQKRALSALP